MSHFVGDIASEAFELENYFAKHEFSTRHLICCSDSESWSAEELLDIAKDDAEIQTAWKSLRFGYTETRGLPALRQVCAEQLNMASADQILMFAGAEEGIFCTFRTLLTKQDHAIVFTPCYQSLLSIPEACAGEATRFDLDPISADGSTGWTIDLAKLERAIQPGRTKVIVMNFPHNPTGIVPPRDVVEAIIALAERHDVFVFCDEIYKGIDRVHSPGGVFPTMAQRYPRKGITLSGVSKSHGLPGLRIGWIACQDAQLLEQIAENKHYLSICNSAPSEIFAWIAVKYRATLWERNLSIVQANLALFQAFVDRTRDAQGRPVFSWVVPTGGCCAFVRVNTFDDATAARFVDVAERIVQEHGLLLLPGSNFPCGDALRAECNRYMRVGLGRRSFPDALAVLESALSHFLTA